jgi:peptidoglycan/xylan/chitin deacetylase (PgdA/CDA1 family)
VVFRFAARDREIALTIDLCDGKDERSYDNALFDLLAAEQIPATVFITGLWARHHTTELRWLTEQSLLEIANHGSRHKPCTVNGRSAFGIAGTRTLEEAIAEINDNANLLEGMTGNRPQFYRSGTAHFDDVCTEAAQLLGQVPMGFSVAGDGGAGFDQAGVERALATANPGAIVILHGHRPNRFAFEGLREALPTLRKRSISFVRLSEVADRLEAR